MKKVIAVFVWTFSLFAQQDNALVCENYPITDGRTIEQRAKSLMLFNYSSEYFVRILKDPKKKSCRMNAVVFLGFIGGDKEAKFLHDLIHERGKVDEDEVYVRGLAVLALGNMARRCVVRATPYLFSIWRSAMASEIGLPAPYPGVDPNIYFANKAIFSLGNIGLVEIENILNRFEGYNGGVYREVTRKAVQVSKEKRMKGCVP